MRLLLGTLVITLIGVGIGILAAFIHEKIWPRNGGRP